MDAEISDNIEQITDWLKNEAPFNGRTDPSFITNFLSRCSNDVEKAKQRIARYYELRKIHPKFTITPDIYDDKIKKLFLGGAITSDFNAKSNHPVVLVGKLDRLDSTDVVSDFLRATMLTGEVGLMESPRVRKYGCVCVYDSENISFNHLMQFTHKTNIPIMQFTTDGMALRYVAIHLINVGVVVKHFFNICKFAFPSDLRNIMHVHSGGWKSLNGHVPAECLPSECGGNNHATLQQLGESVWNAAVKWREYFSEEEIYGYSKDNSKH